MRTHRMLRLWANRAAVARWALLGGVSVFVAAGAQSPEVKEPSHLMSGVNRGTLDSIAGTQYWDFRAMPGRFQLVFAPGSPQEAFSVGRQPRVAVTFAPETPGATLTQRMIPGGGTVFAGSVTQPTHVMAAVEPVKSPGVRLLTDYTLVATGDVDLHSAPTPVL